MDTVRSIDGDAVVEDVAVAEPRMDAPPQIGSDERRMHVRAYNHWVSLLGGRAYPSIADLDPASISDFGSHSVLLDFSVEPENPAIPFLGAALRTEGGHDHSIRCLRDVPGGSLVSRLTDHYLEIIANRAPIGFEAEFVNMRGYETMYRGILMPFSSDGTTIDYVYGVINWKELAASAINDALLAEVTQALEETPRAPAPSIAAWADGPNAAPRADYEQILPEAMFEVDVEPGDAFDGEIAFASPISGSVPADFILPESEYAPVNDDEDVELADCLADARDGAKLVRTADGRSRAALYRALGLAYDFALLADLRREDYADLLSDAGLKVQARAPMTAVIKLVFGAGYDKTRVTEFAAALAYGRRTQVGAGRLRGLLETHPGGLKGIVAAERTERRPAERAAPIDAVHERIRALPTLGHTTIAAEAEFVLLIGRREADGSTSIVATSAEQALVDRALRHAAR